MTGLLATLKRVMWAIDKDTWNWVFLVVWSVLTFSTVYAVFSATSCGSRPPPFSATSCGTSHLGPNLWCLLFSCAVAFLAFFLFVWLFGHLTETSCGVCDR